MWARTFRLFILITLATSGNSLRLLSGRNYKYRAASVKAAALTHPHLLFCSLDVPFICLPTFAGPAKEYSNLALAFNQVFMKWLVQFQAPILSKLLFYRKLQLLLDAAWLPIALFQTGWESCRRGRG